MVESHFEHSQQIRLKNKCISDERQCNTGRKLPLNHSAQAMQKVSTVCNCCYRVFQKPWKIAAKIAKNTRFEISQFTLPPIVVKRLI